MTDRFSRWLAVSAVGLVLLGGIAGVVIERPGVAPQTEPTTPLAPPAARPPTTPAPVQPAADVEGRPDLPADVRRDLDEVWRRSPAGCLTVTDGPQPLYGMNPAEPVRAASVLKLFTAIAAVDTLGSTTRLSTSVRVAIAPIEGVVDGNLYLVGGGDPVLGTDVWAAATDAPLHSSLDTLADQVVASGVSTLRGGVVGDESRYDVRRHVESWPRRLLDDGEVGPLSALSVNDGFSTWGHPGVPFHRPAVGAAAVFANLLRSRGVRVGPPAMAGSVPDGQELASVQSPDVRSLVEAMLRDSDNGTAELLLKEVGRSSGEGATTAGGARTALSTLEKIGLPTARARLADGSGLSADDLVTCRLIAAALTARPEAVGPGLPRAGESGTLSTRFRDTDLVGRLRAKTGSLDGIAAMAGYIDTASGRTLTFAFICNGLPLSDSGRSLQDRVVTALRRA